MFLGKSVAVVVPAFREEALIDRTVTTVPAFVDAIYVVDDASTDATAAVVEALADPRVKVLSHPVNRGVGAAVVTGYQAALADAHDILCVMAGDAQMDPADLEHLARPIALGTADYAKGNRFAHARWRDMPRMRHRVGQCLSFLTRLATRLSVTDTQCGYTALGATAARTLPLQGLWPSYGYPNDLLGWLAARRQRVVEVVVRPVYGQERSGIRPWHVVLILLLLVRAWWRCTVSARTSRGCRGWASRGRSDSSCVETRH